MAIANCSDAPRVFNVDDKLCSFVRRVIPAGHQLEIDNAFHDGVVILAFRGSSWLSRQSGRSYHETPGTVVVRDAGQVFSTKTVQCDPVKGSDCHEIHISPEGLAGILAVNDADECRKIDFSNPVLKDEDLHRRVIHTLSAFENHECGLMRETCLHLLLRDIANVTNRKEAGTRGRRSHRRHREVVDYMRANFDAEITLQDLAEIARVNQFVLLRQFRDEYGVTPHQYLRTYRINKAMAFIRQGLRLADVAQLCGFFDQSHLNRQFKRTVGVSPGRFFSRVLE
jgi:AraC-like DNA-binding protein